MNTAAENQPKSSELVQDSTVNSYSDINAKNGTNTTDSTERKSIKPGYQSMKNPSKILYNNGSNDINNSNLHIKPEYSDDIGKMRYSENNSLTNLQGADMGKDKSFAIKSQKYNDSYYSGDTGFNTKITKNESFSMQNKIPIFFSQQQNVANKLNSNDINNDSKFSENNKNFNKYEDEFKNNKYTSVNNNSFSYGSKRYYVPTYVHFDRW